MRESSLERDNRLIRMLFGITNIHTMTKYVHGAIGIEVGFNHVVDHLKPFISKLGSLNKQVSHSAIAVVL